MGSTDGAKKVRTSFTVNKKDWETFTDLIARLKLRRDSFLNDGLRAEVEELRRLEPNTKKSEAYLKEERGRDEAWELIDVEFIKVNLSLERALLDDVNLVCAEKRVPRDIFLEAYIEFLVSGAANGSTGSPLHAAVNLIECPREGYAYAGETTWYDDLSIPDEEVDFRRKMRSEETLVAEAIAEIQGIDMPTAIKSLEVLSLKDKEQVYKHAKVREIVEKLKSRTPTVVSLDDLIPLDADEKVGGKTPASK